jgi:ADP-ribose pyrophosphatase
MPDDHLRETTIERRVVHAGQYLTFRIDTIRDPSGAVHTREIADHPGAVAIVALDGNDVLLVRQYRHAAGHTLLEIPAGTRDRLDDGSVETPERCAERELSEETGHRADSWRKLGAFWTAPGFTNELMHLYLAQELSRVHDWDGPQPDEHLDLVRIPWREAVEMCEGGEIEDAKSIVGLFWLSRLADRGEL